MVKGTYTDLHADMQLLICVQLTSVEAPAAETELVMPSQRNKADEVHVGLSWTEGLGKFKLSKVITLAPRFLIKNNLPFEIAVREHGSATKSTLTTGARHSLFATRAGKEKLLTIAYPGLNAQW